MFVGHGRGTSVQQQTDSACSGQCQYIGLFDDPRKLFEGFVGIGDQPLGGQLRHVIGQSAAFHGDQRAFALYHDFLKGVVFRLQYKRTGIGSCAFFLLRFIQQVLEQQTIVCRLVIQQESTVSIRDGGFYKCGIGSLEHDRGPVNRLTGRVGNFACDGLCSSCSEHRTEQ